MSEFDQFAANYRALTAASIAASGEDPEFFAQYKARDLRDLIDRSEGPPPTDEILDFGCGVGSCLVHLRREFPQARVRGIDPSAESVNLAQRFPGDPDVQAFDGASIPFPDGSFDVVFAAGVFHHVPPPQREAVARELHRVAKPGGLAFVYEHNPVNPLTRRAVKACPYDEGVTLLPSRELVGLLRDAGFGSTDRRYRVFFPHFLALLRPLERYLARVPLGAQYFVAGRKSR